MDPKAARRLKQLKELKERQRKQKLEPWEDDPEDTEMQIAAALGLIAYILWIIALNI